MSDIGGVAAPGYMFGLANLERKRNLWISRLEQLEKQWQEFMKSSGASDSDTLMRTAEYSRKKDNFIKMLSEIDEQYRVEQQIEEQRRADEMRTAAMADYYEISSRQRAPTRPNFDTIDVALFERLKKYPEQRKGKKLLETLHDLTKFMIYFIKMDQYPAMKDEIIAVRRVLNDDSGVSDHLPGIAQALRYVVNDYTSKLNPDDLAQVDNASKQYVFNTGIDDNEFRGGGGHKSARRGKSKSKSRSKCRSRSRSKSRHRHRG